MHVLPILEAAHGRLEKLFGGGNGISVGHGASQSRSVNRFDLG
jgi:hypothetical protein